jgi:hypothetical protein
MAIPVPIVVFSGCATAREGAAAEIGRTSPTMAGRDALASTREHIIHNDEDGGGLTPGGTLYFLGETGWLR